MSPSGGIAEPGPALDGLDWIAATVPGTAAQALREAGQWSLDAPGPLHDKDIWYRLPFAGEGPRTLCFEGLATLAEVWLNGKPILRSDTMFVAREVDCTLRGDNDLLIVFRSLSAALAATRGRARWRTRLAQPGGLRAIRTTLLGHMPGWCPPIDAVGPWRAVTLIERTGPLRVGHADIRTSVVGGTGIATATLDVAWTGEARPVASLRIGDVEAPLHWTDAGTLAGDLRLPGVRLWWPHTHGEPSLHAVSMRIGDVVVDLGRTGFRTLDVDRGGDGHGFDLRVNGTPVFARGACWAPADIVSLAGDRATCRPALEAARDAGMNTIRVGGTMVYETAAFHDLCDELGMLVWQDFMFANFDYPADDGFLASVREEARQTMDRLQASPSLVVVCGGSEVEQQAAMLGLPVATRAGAVFEDILPTAVAEARDDVVWLRNAPTGGALPFEVDRGVSHYYGVGAYRRPLEDARRSGVRFAAECLAFANVPDAAMTAAVLGDAGFATHHPRWKRAVPRDPGAGWDFEDVRDHYLRLLYGVDPVRQRMEDPDRYLRLSRAATGEVMAGVFSEWRRAGSTCAGGLAWMLRDVEPGAGWGLLDADGAAKPCLHALRQVLRPVQLVATDEGLNGLAFHLVNETAATIEGRLSLRCLREGEIVVARAERPVALAPRSTLSISSGELLGRFFDITAAYHFGPAALDVSVATLTDAATGAVLSEAFHFPQGRGSARAELGLAAVAERDNAGWSLRLSTRRLAQSVHVEDTRFRADDEWFHLAQGVERVIRLTPRSRAGEIFAPTGEVHALNAAHPISIARAA